MAKTVLGIEGLDSPLAFFGRGGSPLGYVLKPLGDLLLTSLTPQKMLKSQKLNFQGTKIIEKD